MERGVRQKGTGWSRTRKETAWTEQKKRMGAGVKSYIKFRDGSQGKVKKEKQKIKPVVYFISYIYATEIYNILYLHK